MDWPRCLPPAAMIVAFAISACADEDVCSVPAQLQRLDVTPAGSLAGRWSGSAADEAFYLELVVYGYDFQSMVQIIGGKACESEGRRCLMISKGSFKDSLLKVSYGADATGGSFRVAAVLSLSADGLALSGTLASSRDCRVL